MTENLKVVLFTSRNKDNKDLEHFKQRSKTFLTTKDKDDKTLIDEFENLERKTKRDFGDFNNQINLVIKKEINAFLYDIEDVVEKYLEDFDIKDYFGRIKKELLGDVVNITINDLFPPSEKLSEEESSLIAEIGEGILIGLGTLVTLGIPTLLTRKDDFRRRANSVFSLLDTKRIGLNVKGNGNRVIENVKKLLLDDLITPIEQKINDTIANKSNKENELKSNKEKLEELKSAKSLIGTQIEEMKVLESQFSTGKLLKKELEDITN